MTFLTFSSCTCIIRHLRQWIMVSLKIMEMNVWLQGILSKVGIMGCQPYIAQVFLEVAKVLILLCYECIVTMQLVFYV